jgi:predicted ATPase
MEYVIAIVVIFYFLYKTMVFLGRKNAIDVICHNYKLDRKKVSALQDIEITSLHISLEEAKLRALQGNGTLGELEAFTKLLNHYR